MMDRSKPDLEMLSDPLIRLRGAADVAPDASIVIPVNAQGDLENVVEVIADCTRYAGSHHFEIVLVVNNFEESSPPPELDAFAAYGLRVVAIPNVRRPGEAVGFSARIPGVRAAQSSTVILFDADCRIPQPTALFDWYVSTFQDGADAGYTPVGYYDYENCLSLRTRFAVHHLARWTKRTVLGIPTTRGSNYAVRRDVMLQLYEQEMLADEMNVGPTFKRQGHRVAYSGRKDLQVLTSGRMFRPGWFRMIPYYWYRLRYNLRTLPVRVGVARHTGRERDPVRKYVNNRPVR
jgi:hypothetical protein